ncbi:uncharacterized protein Dvar_57270 [Desulfosarcina variabilis str. Montpellier]
MIPLYCFSAEAMVGAFFDMFIFFWLPILSFSKRVAGMFPCKKCGFYGLVINICARYPMLPVKVSIFLIY